MIRFCILLASLWLLFSCESGSYDGFSSNKGMSEPEWEESSSPKMAFEENNEQNARFISDMDGEQSGDQKLEESEKIDKKIIKTANLSLEVESIKKVRDKIETILDELDAYITNESQNNHSYRLESHLTIKVAPKNFGTLINQIEELALRVENKVINTKDVTTQFVDMEARLKNKRAVADRYRNILKNAKTIPDILAVEENLRKVTEEIESVEGQLKYLQNQVSFSTLNLNLFETLDQPPTKRRNFFKKLGNAFVSGWYVLLDLITGLVNIWPVILILGVVLFWIVRRRKKRK